MVVPRKKRVINTLQKAAQSTLVVMDADVALASLTEVFARIQKAADESLRGVDLPFSVLEPRVESCRPVDPEVARASLERQRIRAEAILEAERSRQNIERAERDPRVRAVQLENERREKEAELQRADMQRAFELTKMIEEAETAIKRDRLKALAAPEIMELNATAEDKRDWIKEKRELEIAKLKAELPRVNGFFTPSNRSIWRRRDCDTPQP